MATNRGVVGGATPKACSVTEARFVDDPGFAMRVASKRLRCSRSCTPGAPSRLPMRPGANTNVSVLATQAFPLRIDKDRITDLYQRFLVTQRVTDSQPFTVPLAAVCQKTQRDPMT